jgi:hypothetical protein
MRHVAQVGNCSTILYLAFPRWLNVLLSQRPTHIMCVCLNLNLNTQNDKWRQRARFMPSSTHTCWELSCWTHTRRVVSLFANAEIVKSQLLCVKRGDLLAICIRGAKRGGSKINICIAAWETERLALALSWSLFLVATSDVGFFLIFLLRANAGNIPSECWRESYFV